MTKEYTFKDLKKAYKKAVETKADTFTIGTYEFLTNYAKYLIQYLDMCHISDDKLLKSFLVKKE